MKTELNEDKVFDLRLDPDLYMVIRKGIYIQGVFGPFTDLSIANGFAKRAANADSDDYHSWNVHRLEKLTIPTDLEDDGLGSIITSFCKENVKRGN